MEQITNHNILIAIIHSQNTDITKSAIHSIKKGLLLPDIAVVCKSNEKEFFLNEGVDIICDDKNMGYASRLNIVRDYAITKGYEHIVFSNNDITVDKMTIGRMYSFIQSHPLTIVGPTILRTDNRIESAGIRLNLITGRNFNLYNGSILSEIKEEILLPDAVAGTFFLLNSKILESVKFDEEYDYYFEDVSFCLKAKERGILPVVLRDANIVHLGSQSIKRFSTQDIAKMVTKNHLKTIGEYSPFKNRPVILIPYTLTILLNLLYFGIKVKKPIDAIKGVTIGSIIALRGKFK